MHNFVLSFISEFKISFWNLALLRLYIDPQHGSILSHTLDAAAYVSLCSEASQMTF